MNKEYIALIAFAIILVSAVFVSGIIAPIENTDDVNVGLSLQKGWNLVPAFDKDRINSNSDIRAGDILATFSYLREKNKCIKFDADDKNTELYNHYYSVQHKVNKII